MKEHNVLYFLTAILGNIIVSSGEITQFPINAAVQVGGTARFNCASNLLVQGWYLSRDGTTTTDKIEIITSYCDVQTGYSAHYKTEPSSGYQATCDLIVFNATMAQAGVYLCSDGLNPNQRAYALMTVLASPPTITANQSDVMVGETLRLSCSIGFNGSVSPAPLLPPSIYWTSSTGVNLSSSLSPSPPPNVVESYILVNPDRSNNSIGPFVCHGYFQQPQNLQNSSLNYATNAPTNTYSTASISFEVFYIPAVKTDGFSEECLSGEEIELNCNASASPPVQFYQWRESTEGVVLANESSVTISTEGIYECIAYNSIRNSPTASSSTPIEINSCSFVSNVTITGGDNCDGGVCYCNKEGWIELSCEADGYPPPNYRWGNVEDPGCILNPNNNPAINATLNGTYLCTADNEFHGTRHYGSASITIFGCASDENSICALHDGETDSSSCDVVCGTFIAVVILWLNFLAVIVFMVDMVCLGREEDTGDDYWKLFLLFECVSLLVGALLLLTSILVCLVKCRSSSKRPSLYRMLLCTKDEAHHSEIRSGAGNTQVISSGPTPYVTPTPLNSLDTSDHNQPYPVNIFGPPSGYEECQSTHFKYFYFRTHGTCNLEVFPIIFRIHIRNWTWVELCTPNWKSTIKVDAAVIQIILLFRTDCGLTLLILTLARPI